MERPLSHLQCLHALLLMTAIVGIGFWSMDALTEPPGAGVDTGETLPEASFHGGSRRVFLLMIDSMPFRTATDPALMPNLVALQPRSAYGKMDTVHDAVSVPALRAAFTGRERVAVFGFVKNLWHGEEGFSSMFTQAREAGLRALVYSDGSFTQFGKDLPVQHETEPNTAEQCRSVEEAMDAFVAGTYDLVIAHVTFTDTVAHVAGFHSERYREEFGLADDLVRRLDEAVPEDATLIVMGDHGHDDMGRHLAGMNVPTFALYRGPGHGRGVDLGEIRIHDTRYLMSWALKLTLPGNYDAGRHPDALRGSVALPGPFAARAEGVSRDDGSIPAGRRVDFALVMIALALVVSLWVGLVRTFEGSPRARRLAVAGAWLALVLLGVAAGRRVGVAAAVIVAAAAVALPLVRGGSRRDVLWALVPTTVLALVPWGYLLSTLRPLIAWPRHRDVTLAWAGAILVGLVLSIRTGAMPAAWTLMAVSGLLLVPTVSHYGAPSALAPLWTTLLLYVVVQNMLRHRRSGLVAEPAAGARYGLLVPILLLLVPFGLVFSTNFKFNEWFVPYVSRWFWGSAVEPVHATGLALAFLAKLIIFIPRRGGVIAIVVGALAAVGVHLLQLYATGLTPEETPRWTFVIGIGVCALAAIGTRRLIDARWHGLSRVVWLVTLYVLFLYAVRVEMKFYLWTDCLLAALFLSGRFLATDFDRAHRPSVYTFLLLLAAAVSAWVTLGWTFHRLEWGFLFDWFEVRFVERKVGLFALLIALRFGIPLVMGRLLLSDAFGDGWTYPQRWVTLLAGAKAFATLMVALGLGFHQVGSDAYPEAVQQTAIWTFVIWALPWHTRPARDELTAPGG